MRVTDDDQSFGMADGQRANKNSVDERIDRRVGADAERESADHESGEGGVAAERPDAIRDVLTNFSDESPTPSGRLAFPIEHEHVAAYTAHVAELLQRRRAGIIRRHSPGDKRVDARLQMKEDLVVDFADEAKPAERNAEHSAHATPSPLCQMGV